MNTQAKQTTLAEDVKAARELSASLASDADYASKQISKEIYTERAREVYRRCVTKRTEYAALLTRLADVAERHGEAVLLLRLVIPSAMTAASTLAEDTETWVRRRDALLAKEDSHA